MGARALAMPRSYCRAIALAGQDTIVAQPSRRLSAGDGDLREGHEHIPLLPPHEKSGGSSRASSSGVSSHSGGSWASDSCPMVRTRSTSTFQRDLLRVSDQENLSRAHIAQIKLDPLLR